MPSDYKKTDGFAEPTWWELALWAWGIVVVIVALARLVL